MNTSTQESVTIEPPSVSIGERLSADARHDLLETFATLEANGVYRIRVQCVGNGHWCNCEYCKYCEHECDIEAVHVMYVDPSANRIVKEREQLPYLPGACDFDSIRELFDTTVFDIDDHATVDGETRVLEFEICARLIHCRRGVLSDVSEPQHEWTCDLREQSGTGLW